jgi:hypothetical protein
MPFHFYADDEQLYVSFKVSSQEDVDSAVARIEACVADIRAWMAANRLKFNDGKTELLTIIPAHQSNTDLNIPDLCIGDCVITPSKTVKNLGSKFDSTLQMDAQVTAVCQSARFHLRNIGRIRRYLSEGAPTRLVHAFITSRLDCNNSLLCGLPKVQLTRLQRVQNSAARLISRTPKRQHISPVLERLHWLPVSERIDYKVLTLTYKSLKGLAPGYLAELLQERRPTRNTRSSSQLLLTEPRSRTVTYGDRAFSRAAPRLWNNLPQSLREATSLNSFKTMLKTFLFKRAYNHC